MGYEISPPTRAAKRPTYIFSHAVPGRMRQIGLKKKNALWSTAHMRMRMRSLASLVPTPSSQFPLLICLKCNRFRIRQMPSHIKSAYFIGSWRILCCSHAPDWSPATPAPLWCRHAGGCPRRKSSQRRMLAFIRSHGQSRRSLSSIHNGIWKAQLAKWTGLWCVRSRFPHFAFP